MWWCGMDMGTIPLLMSIVGGDWSDLTHSGHKIWQTRMYYVLHTHTHNVAGSVRTGLSWQIKRGTTYFDKEAHGTSWNMMPDHPNTSQTLLPLNQWDPCKLVLSSGQAWISHMNGHIIVHTYCHLYMYQEELRFHFDNGQYNLVIQWNYCPPRYTGL